MVNMDKLLVAFQDKKNKAAFNKLLVDAFDVLGGADNNAVETLVDALIDAGINLKKTRKESRACLIGKLGVMGVKKIVKKKVTKKRDPDEPTKDDLVKKFVNLLELDLSDLDTLNNMRKGEIQVMIDAVKALIK